MGKILNYYLGNIKNFQWWSLEFYNTAVNRSKVEKREKMNEQFAQKHLWISNFCLDDVEENIMSEAEHAECLSLSRIQNVCCTVTRKKQSFLQHHSSNQTKQCNMSSVIFVRKHVLFLKRSKNTFWRLFTTFFSCFSQRAFHLLFIVSIHLVLVCLFLHVQLRCLGYILCFSMYL